jgi:hypothetical protein
MTAPLLLQLMATARSRAATGRSLQQQGASALQRSSGEGLLTSRAGVAAVRLRLLERQRQALGEQKGNDVDDGNQKGGV